ncbi:GbsR/MarR family transcriptional regulator [Gudongella sp. SC589]|jgi:DNA-binding transcriptional regulator GbsR (MarR family)|uniref:GbsR/MarR family transcriptional regulator n=1 Tax=Gudongella sp. SC589 TaxID=3385990 RepID=UPI003904A672
MSDDRLKIANQVEDIKNKATAALSKQINFYGLNLSESRLFSLMFLEDSPMTLDDMSKQLGMSKTSMSTGIHSLQDAKMVEQTWKKGVRKDLYKAEENLYASFSNTYLEKWFSVIGNNRKIFNSISRDIASLLEKVEDDELRESLMNYSHKIKGVLQFYTWLEAMFKDMKERIDNMEFERE